MALLLIQVSLHSSYNYNRCALINTKVKCIGRNLIYNTHDACKDMNYLTELLEEPYYAKFIDTSVHPIYNSDFFKMYHPENLKNKDFSKLSNTIKEIANNIYRKYYKYPQYERARLMINELTQIRVYDEMAFEDVLLFDDSDSLVKMDEAFCNAQNNNQYVYPVVTVGEGKKWQTWMLHLSFGGLMNQTRNHAINNYKNYFRHDFLQYDLKTIDNKEEQSENPNEISQSTVAQKFVTESSKMNIKQPVVLTEDLANIKNFENKKNI